MSWIGVCDGGGADQQGQRLAGGQRARVEVKPKTRPDVVEVVVVAAVVVDIVVAGVRGRRRFGGGNANANANTKPGPDQMEVRYCTTLRRST